MTKKQMKILAFVVGSISLVMFYMIGGWMLPVAAILFGWCMNLENDAKGRR